MAPEYGSLRVREERWECKTIDKTGSVKSTRGCIEMKRSQGVANNASHNKAQMT